MSRTAVLVLLLVLSACAAREEGGTPPLPISLLAAEGRCAVRAVEVACADVPAYLRDTLKIPPDTFINVGVNADLKKTKELQAIVSAITAAGFTQVMGTVDVLEGAR